jgi:hypothetical protein
VVEEKEEEEDKSGHPRQRMNYFRGWEGGVTLWGGGGRQEYSLLLLLPSLLVLQNLIGEHTSGSAAMPSSGACVCARQ